MDVSEKKYVEKRWQKMKSWQGKETNKNISARSLTLWSGGVGIFLSTTTWTRVSDATDVTFSVKMF